MRTIRRLNSFKKDYKREAKGKSAAYVQKLDSELASLLRMLALDEPLQPRHVDHALSGTYTDTRDCHVRPDLILIYRKPDPGTLELVRLGTHAELFG